MWRTGGCQQGVLSRAGETSDPLSLYNLLVFKRRWRSECRDDYRCMWDYLRIIIRIHSPTLPRAPVRQRLCLKTVLCIPYKSARVHLEAASTASFPTRSKYKSKLELLPAIRLGLRVYIMYHKEARRSSADPGKRTFCRGL